MSRRTGSKRKQCKVAVFAFARKLPEPDPHAPAGNPTDPFNTDKRRPLAARARASVSFKSPRLVRLYRRAERLCPTSTSLALIDAWRTLTSDPCTDNSAQAKGFFSCGGRVRSPPPWKRCSPNSRTSRARQLPRKACVVSKPYAADVIPPQRDPR